MQAGIGNVVAGSAFSIAQSLGATGAIATLGVFGAATGVGALIGLGIWAFSGKKEDK